MNINILVGLPASGKTSYPKKGLTFSSDEIRKELFGNEASQEDNGKVFETLFKRLKKAIEEGEEEVNIDATNITKKNRRKIFNIINQTKKKPTITAIVFEVPIEELIRRDLERERTVGEDVIYRMLGGFNIPTYDEGFNEIIFIRNNNREIKADNVDDFLIEIKDDILFKKMIGLEQKSYYHQETLVEHLSMIYDLILKFGKDYDILTLLTIFHDIGKGITRKTRRENLLDRGYTEKETNESGVVFISKSGEIGKTIERPDDFQFIGHETFSANIFRFNYKELLIRNKIITREIADMIEKIIRCHLLFHKLEEDFIEIDGVIYNEDDELFRIGKIFSEFDSLGRITLENNN